MGALVEPMAVAWHAADRGRVSAGQSALIAGAGPIGIGVWFALRARGVKTIVVSEPSAVRREAIARLGADRVVDPVKGDLAGAVAEATQGRGVDVAFDASGAGPAVGQALAQLTPQGVLVVVALHEKPFGFNPTTLVMSETAATGSLGYLQKDFDAVIRAMAQGQYTAQGWVADVEIGDVVRAFGELRAGRGMKVLVKAPAA
jgi:(R,R)-butanediol dehydrogenase/meso-butanediol dehydrogenase/diacetyl reductase